MIWPALFSYFHLLVVGLAAGLKLTEHWLLSRPPDRLQVRLLGTVRLGFLLALIAVLATGLVRLGEVAGEQRLTLDNPLFVLKIGLFGLLALASLPGSRTLLRWTREARTAASFAVLSRDLELLRATVALELGLLALLPLPAVLLSRGFALGGP